MTKTPASPSNSKLDRDARLAAQLRENLRRRKAVARKQKAAQKTDESST